MSIVSNINNDTHYQWGNGCDGWILVDTPGLQVKQERMPPQTAEQIHYHQFAQQFFFILKGMAQFEVEGQSFTVPAGNGFFIAAGKKHRILNSTGADLEFILSSQPTTQNDRINCL